MEGLEALQRLQANRAIASASAGGQRKAMCANCRIATSQELVSSRPVWPDLVEIGSGEESKASPFVKLQIWGCTFCGKTTLLLLTFEKDDKGAYKLADTEQVWPGNPPRELPDQAPLNVRSLYREASVAENVGALRAAAVLYRAAVEELVRDQGAKGGNLEDRIDDLVNRGVDEDLVRDLHEARTTGNWSIHEGIKFSAAEVGDVALLIGQAVDFLYVQPARREAMRDARAKRREASKGLSSPSPEEEKP